MRSEAPFSKIRKTVFFVLQQQPSHIYMSSLQPVAGYNDPKSSTRVETENDAALLLEESDVVTLKRRHGLGKLFPTLNMLARPVSLPR